MSSKRFETAFVILASLGIRDVKKKLEVLENRVELLEKTGGVSPGDLDEHRTAVPIDHPESSIEMRHLAKDVKEEFLRIALSTLVNRALLHAETKDFYTIVADVWTRDYPNGYYGTIAKVLMAGTPITITERSGSDLTDYSVKITLDETWDGWDSVIDGSDIYFLDDQGNPLYYWIEKFDPVNKHAVIWVKIPFLPANTSITIYMHYGEENPYSSYHDPEQVFLFFDDFNTLDTNKWVVKTTGSASVTVSDGCILFSTGTTIHSEASIDSKNSSFGFRNVLIETRYMVLSVGVSDDRALQEHYFDASLSNGLHITHNGPAGEFVNRRVNGVWESAIKIYDNPPVNTWLRHQTIVYDDKSVLRLLDDNGNILGSHTYTGFAPTIDLMKSIGAVNHGSDTDLRSKLDWILVRKYVEPEPGVSIGESEVGKVETSDLDFPDGIDKILVTVDSDAQETYYSTDGGETWNPLVLDEEILLPETATRIRLRFANMTYFRGYAMIGW